MMFTNLSVQQSRHPLLVGVVKQSRTSIINNMKVPRWQALLAPIAFPLVISFQQYSERVLPVTPPAGLPPLAEIIVKV